MKNKLITITGIIYLFLLSSNYGFCQEEKLIKSTKLIKDFEQLITIFDAHPDPYTHIPEEEFKATLDSIKASLDHPHTALEFYRKAATTVALLKDGHSALYMPKNWLNTQRKDRGAFPFEVYLTNEDELYIIKNFNENNGIQPGTQIMEINNISVDSFLSTIDPYISYELKPFRNTLITRAFESYLYIAFGFTEKTSLTYVYNNTTTTTAVDNMPYKEWKRFQKNDREERDIKIARGEPYSYETLTKGIGLLKIYAFFAEDESNYNLFLSKTFRTIRKDSVQSLIIDIRGNFGGWPKIASRIFHYISEGHFKTMARSSMKVSYPYRNYFLSQLPPGVSPSRIPYLTKRRHFVDLNAVLKDPIDTYVNEEIFFNEKPQTEIFEFTGDCYLLTNRDSYSAASSFASTFQCYQIGAIIGEETGGTKIFRANPMRAILTRSGLGVSMSTTILYTTCYNEEFEGVKPNAYFTPSIVDICSEKDSQLFYLIGLIKQVERVRKAEANE